MPLMVSIKVFAMVLDELLIQLAIVQTLSKRDILHALTQALIACCKRIISRCEYTTSSLSALRLLINLKLHWTTQFISIFLGWALPSCSIVILVEIDFILVEFHFRVFVDLLHDLLCDDGVLFVSEAVHNVVESLIVLVARNIVVKETPNALIFPCVRFFVQIRCDFGVPQLIYELVSESKIRNLVRRPYIFVEMVRELHLLQRSILLQLRPLRVNCLFFDLR